jgi:hypothetical protein
MNEQQRIAASPHEVVNGLFFVSKERHRLRSAAASSRPVFHFAGKLSAAMQTASAPVRRTGA